MNPRDPIEKTGTISEAPVISQVPYKLIQCDTQDADPQMGFYLNLELANDPLGLSNTEYECLL
jgi:hypothetical protein